MTDYRTMFDSEHLYAFHLQGREVTLQIDRVKAGELVGERGKKSKKPLVYFKGKEKPLALNKTNAKVIAGLYGKSVEAWAGKLVTIFPTTTQFGNETCDCIRVRPAIPSGKARPEAINETLSAPDVAESA